MDMTKFKHLYISPLEACNLRCQMCYTVKTGTVLKTEEILAFVTRVKEEIDLKSITFCGGEVMILPWFPQMVNQLVDKYYIQIITNGTIDRLREFSRPDNINLIVSLDGIPSYHNQNRGQGSWQRSLDWLIKAQKLGFKIEIFSIVTQENALHIDEFEVLLTKQLGELPPITYHPRKPLGYLKNHPWSNRLGEVDNFSFPDLETIESIAKTKKIFPPPKLGCYQLALMSDKHVYGCCEGFTPLGTIKTPIKTLITNLTNQVKQECAEPCFRCGLKGKQ